MCLNFSKCVFLVFGLILTTSKQYFRLYICDPMLLSGMFDIIPNTFLDFVRGCITSLLCLYCVSTVSVCSVICACITQPSWMLSVDG